VALCEARDLLHDYLYQAENPTMDSGYLRTWEKRRFMIGCGIKPPSLIPGRCCQQSEKHHSYQDRGCLHAMVSNLLRKTVPRMLEQWRVEHRIDDYDFQFSADFFLKYYNRYVHKYLVYFFIGLNLIIGISNGILYLILG
jgi:hypothetical protein